MIHYQLGCACGHGFDGWFQGSAAFDRQKAAGLIQCPVCGGASVDRALMTPAVARKALTRRAFQPPGPEDSSVPVPASVPGPPAAVLPDQVRAVLQKMRTRIEQTCENVGDTLPETARQMHSGEIEQRAIYGNATPDEAEALLEEGIPLVRIPWVPPADS